MIYNFVLHLHFSYLSAVTAGPRAKALVNTPHNRLMLLRLRYILQSAFTPHKMHFFDRYLFYAHHQPQRAIRLIYPQPIDAPHSQPHKEEKG